MLWKIRRIPLPLSPAGHRYMQLLHRATKQRRQLGLRHSTGSMWARSWASGRSHAATARSRRPKSLSGVNRWPVANSSSS